MILLDPATRCAMGEAARERVAARYDHEGFCRALIAWYVEALDSAHVPVDRLSQSR